jgi:hypothetical protein
MVNQSKVNDPRFWKKWRESGAVGTIDDAYRNIGKQAKPRVLVFGRHFSDDPFDQSRYEQELERALGDSVSQVRLYGEGAYCVSADNLVEWAVIGKGRAPHMDKTIPGGCDIYVGIKTPEKDFVGWTAKDGLDGYAMGERGLKLAEKARVPTLMLGSYDSKRICDFVQEQSR